MELLKKKDIPL